MINKILSSELIHFLTLFVYSRSKIIFISAAKDVEFSYKLIGSRLRRRHFIHQAVITHYRNVYA